MAFFTFPSLKSRLMFGHKGLDQHTVVSVLTKHTYKNKDRVTRTSLKTGGELRCRQMYNG